MKKFTLALVLALSVLSFGPKDVFALPNPIEVQQRLNTSANAGPEVLLGYQVVSGKPQVLRCFYDFSKQGGAVGTIKPKDISGAPCALPQGAIVFRTFTHTITAPTSGGAATIALGVNSTVDLVAATGFASFITAASACLDGVIVPATTAPNFVRVPSVLIPRSQVAVNMTVATAALTAGKLEFFIEYFLGL